MQIKINIKRLEIPVNEAFNVLFIFFCTISAISIGVFYWVFRLGFNENNISDIIKVVTFSHFIIIAPFFLTQILKNKNTINKWYLTEVGFQILLFFCITIIGALCLFSDFFYFFYFTIPLGGGLLVWFLRLFFISRIKKKAIYSIIFFLFAIFLPAFFYRTFIQDPLFIEKIIIGTAHYDTLYLAALSNIIKTYSIPSIAIDGLVYHTYHWGSNWLFAFLSVILNFSILKFYNLAFPVIFIPFFFRSFFLLLLQLLKFRNEDNNIGLFFVILFFAIINNFTSDIELNDNPVFTHIIFQSESYSVSISLFLLVLAISLSFFSNFKEQKSKKLFIFIFIPFLLAIISVTKISIGFILFAIIGYCFIRFLLYKKISYVLTFIGYSIIFFGAYKITRYMPTDKNMEVEFFSFFKEMVSNDLYFILIFFFYAFMAFITFFYFYKITSFKKLFSLIKDGKTIEFEILLVVIIAGLIPVFFIDLTGRNALYFIDIQRWLSIILLIIILPEILKKIKNQKRKTHNIFFYFVIVCFLFLTIINIPTNYYRHFKDVIIQNLYVRNSIMNKFNNQNQTLNFSSLIFNYKENIDKAQKAIEFLPEYNLISELQKLAELSREEKKISCIYIPKTNKFYWGILEKPKCTALIASAITGIAMIEGVPENMTLYYGFSDYLYNTHSSKIFSDIEIVEVAHNKGFKKVFVIESISDTTIVRVVM